MSKNTQPMKLPAPQAVPVPILKLWTLGPFRAERCLDPSANPPRYESIGSQAWKGEFAKALLKFLLCSRQRFARKEVIQAALWPTYRQGDSQTVLSKALATLQAISAPYEILVVEEDVRGIALKNQSIVWVDADQCVQLMDQAMHETDTQHRLSLLESCIDQFLRGPFLEGDDYVWAQGRAATLEMSKAAAIELLVEVYQQQGNFWKAEKLLLTILEHHLDEDTACTLLALYAERQQYRQALTIVAQWRKRYELEDEPVPAKIESLAAYTYKQWNPVAQLTSLPPLQIPSASSLFMNGFSGMPLQEKQQTLTRREGQTIDAQRRVLLQQGLHWTSTLETLAQPDLWAGSKLAHLLTTVDYYCAHPQRCLELQMIIGQELATIPFDMQQKEHWLSRRQLLMTLAHLPTATLFALLQGRDQQGRIEHFLGYCAASLAACWHLLKGNEYLLVDEILGAYLVHLETLAYERSSPLSPCAASLVTQAYRLKGIVALHRNHLKDRDDAFTQALFYAEISQHAGLLAAACISLAYHQTDPLEAEKLYQHALRSESALSPLQRSRLSAQLAVVYAQQNRETEALSCFDEAQKFYPQRPEHDPSFLYAEFGVSSLILEQGRMFLALAAHQPKARMAQKAWEIFAHTHQQQAEQHGSERIRYEIINYQAETALILEERDLCCDYIIRGAQGAERLKSIKRRNELLVTTNKAVARWPQDQHVQQLSSLFPSQQETLEQQTNSQ